MICHSQPIRGHLIRPAPPARPIRFLLLCVFISIFHRAPVPSHVPITAPPKKDMTKENKRALYFRQIVKQHKLRNSEVWFHPLAGFSNVTYGFEGNSVWSWFKWRTQTFIMLRRQRKKTSEATSAISTFLIMIYWASVTTAQHFRNCCFSLCDLFAAVNNPWP